jgi:hypothetical protein
LSNTPIATLLTDNSELDQQLLGMLLHRGQAPAKQLSRRLKFVDFCVNQGYLPLPIPTEPVTYMRFMLWLPANGITSGWKGCLSYASEVAAWNRQLGFTDTRLEISYWWSTFKLNFRNMVLCHKANTKMPLRASMLLMLLDSLDLGHLPHGSVTHLRDAAAYTLLYFTSQRIGHVALAVGGSRAHLLRFGNLLFWPSLTAPTIVFILFPSTKTHRAAENNGFWSAIATQPQLRFCPVMLLRLLFMRTFRGDQNGFLFTMSNRTDPLTRSTFTHNLRRRLGAAGVDVKDYSGISFRRGALSTLGQSGLASHALADFADHADVQTSRTYITDSMEARANTGRIIGDALHSADRWTTLPTLTRRLSFGSIPAGAAHVLYAANLFGDADAAFTALLEANPQLPLADKASTNGFSNWNKPLLSPSHSIDSSSKKEAPLVDIYPSSECEVYRCQRCGLFFVVHWTE